LFVKIASVVVKATAWLFLLYGVGGGLYALLGRGSFSAEKRWLGIPVIIVYTITFFFLYLISEMADLLIEIKDEVGQSNK